MEAKIDYPKEYKDLKPIDFNSHDAKKTDVRFRLFQKRGDKNGKILTEETVKTVNMYRDLPTKCFIHGWTSNEETYWYNPLRDAYFRKGSYNIFYIDWSGPANKSFHESAANSKPVGEFIADFFMASKINVKNIHIIAHSLGAHVAGFAGKHVFGKIRRKVGRITATDPAGPLFERKEVTQNFRLCKDDAEFVDVVHTDIGHYGFIAPIGHVDFYPNGGTKQPGCPPLTEDENCYHARSNLYFIESVNSDNFKATSCQSWNDYLKGKCSKRQEIIFGENTPWNARGKFYFITNPASPFAMGKRKYSTTSITTMEQLLVHDTV